MTQQVSALHMKTSGRPTLISIDGSFLSLRETLGDELTLIKPFGTYVYAFNAMAQDNGEPFNRIIREQGNKVSKIYGDFVVFNFQIVGNQSRPIMIDFTIDDIHAINEELGLRPEEVIDNRVHKTTMQVGLISDIKQELEDQNTEIKEMTKHTMGKMDTSGLIIGHTYGNGKGQYRKIRKFTNLLGHEVTEPINIWYVRCNENGAIFGAGKEKECYATTFCQWVKEHIGNVGNFPD